RGLVASMETVAELPLVKLGLGAVVERSAWRLGLAGEDGRTAKGAGAKVHQRGVSILGADQQVVAFEVAVEASGGVRGLERAGGLSEHTQHLARGARPKPRPRVQGQAVHPIHDEEGEQ